MSTKPIRKCASCHEKTEDQFIQTFETLDHDHFKLHVCEWCAEEHAEYEEQKNMHYISHITGDYYASEEII